MIHRAWIASFRDAIMNGAYDDDLEELSAIEFVTDSEMLSIADAAKTRRGVLSLATTGDEQR